MILALLALAVIVIALLVKIHLLKKSAREVRTQFAERLQSDTNNLIYLSGSDKDMRKLADDINVQLKELRAAHQRYTQGDRELREAVTNISHDIRTPLTAICGYLDLLNKEETSEQAKQYLNIIAERTDVIRALTDEMLTYSVSVSEKQFMARETVILNHVLEESVSAFYGVLTEHSITPEITICEQPVERKLNRTALSRILANVLSNAVKYSAGDLSISLTETGVLRFENTAAAMDEITIGKLFQRFYTVENAGKSTGLGLSIAKNLTEQMGGSIQVLYESGKMCIELRFESLS